nr:MAG TPA: hypothetical protein [Caudoviricetes sp.]
MLVRVQIRYQIWALLHRVQDGSGYRAGILCSLVHIQGTLLVLSVVASLYHFPINH